jgi:hypothetical protein
MTYFARNQGSYTKIGNLVHIQAWISWTANGFSASSGSMILAGAPFTNTPLNDHRGGLAITYSETAFSGLTIYQQMFREEVGSNTFTHNFSNSTNGNMSASLSSYTQINGVGSMMILWVILEPTQ